MRWGTGFAERDEDALKPAETENQNLLMNFYTVFIWIGSNKFENIILIFVSALKVALFLEKL
jgi:hypothetical protein